MLCGLVYDWESSAVFKVSLINVCILITHSTNFVLMLGESLLVYHCGVRDTDRVNGFLLGKLQFLKLLIVPSAPDDPLGESSLQEHVQSPRAKQSLPEKTILCATQAQ